MQQGSSKLLMIMQRQGVNRLAAAAAKRGPLFLARCSSSSSSARSFSTVTPSSNNLQPPNSSRRHKATMQTQRRLLATAPMDSEDEEERRFIAADLFDQFAKFRSIENKERGTTIKYKTLDYDDLRELLRGIGEAQPQDKLMREIFDVADADRNGQIELNEFLDHSDFILGRNPARIILLVGGPGCGKGTIAQLLQEQCHVVHLSSGDMLRDEVARGSALGNQVQETMARGDLVSSAVIVALMKKHMRNHPGKRVLLDGFPRSAENAKDLITYCGTPELALHLVCDDTVLLERILGRGANLPEEERREDDNFDTALERLRTFHRHHPSTLEWLREHRVPIINLDCSGPPKTVWDQLQAIGRLMRPAVKVPSVQKEA